MVKSVKYTVRKLESVDVTKTVLYLGINNKLCQTEDFSHEMESIPETRLLSLFCS